MFNFSEVSVRKIIYIILYYEIKLVFEKGPKWNSSTFLSDDVGRTLAYKIQWPSNLLWRILDVIATQRAKRATSPTHTIRALMVIALKFTLYTKNRLLFRSWELYNKYTWESYSPAASHLSARKIRSLLSWVTCILRTANTLY